MLSTPKSLGIVISRLESFLSGMFVTIRRLRVLTALIDGSSELTSMLAPVLSDGYAATRFIVLVYDSSITSPFLVNVRKENPATGAVLGGPRTPETSKLISVLAARSPTILPSKFTVRISGYTLPLKSS